MAGVLQFPSLVWRWEDFGESRDAKGRKPQQVIVQSYQGTPQLASTEAPGEHRPQLDVQGFFFVVVC